MFKLFEEFIEKLIKCKQQPWHLTLSIKHPAHKAHGERNESHIGDGHHLCVKGAVCLGEVGQVSSQN